MKKSLLAAAALAALAVGSAGSANAGVAGGSLHGLKNTAPSSISQQVHWRHGWHKHRRVKHCVWRHGVRRCWWR